MFTDGFHALSSIVLFDRALKEAKELDDEFASTKTLRGPLHGVPVGFKDQCKSSEILLFRVR